MLPMPKVSVLGMGNMGAALARALLRHGCEVVVWNRTAERAAPVVAEGAVLAPTPEAAISASPLSLMCVLDHRAASELLQSAPVAAALDGKAFVQLTSSMPDEVTREADHVVQCGARYLAGGIMVFADSIGTPEASIVFAGNQSLHDEFAVVLGHLAGSSKYLGVEPSLAIAAYCTSGIFALGSIGMFLETAALARHYGISIETYTDLARATSGLIFDRVRASAERIGSGNFAGDDARIDVIHKALRSFCDTFARTGVDVRMSEAFTAQLKAASSAGYGEHDIAAIVESLWNTRSIPRDSGERTG